MVSALVLLLLLLAAAVIGLLLLVQFAPLRSLPAAQAAFAALTLGALLLGWLALLLAELNLFSAYTVAGLWLGAAALLLALARRRGRLGRLRFGRARSAATDGQDLRAKARWAAAILVTFWLIALLWLFFRPHEYILGGADAGVYVSLGAEIAAHGGFRLSDQTLAALDPLVRDAFLRPLPFNPVASSYLFPGFYVLDPAAGRIAPQFYPLHPVWQALGFAFSGTAVTGATTALLFSGLWMALGTMAVVLLGAELGGWPLALLLMLGLPITALQGWFARYPTTEALTQYLFWAGLWAMLLWQRGRAPARLWAFLAGAALGVVFLVRIDNLVLLPVFALFLFALWFRGWGAADTWFAVPFLALLLHSLAHGALLSAPYFYEHVGFGLRLLWANNWLLLLGSLLGAGFLWTAWSIRRRGTDFGRLRTPLLLAAVAAFLAFVLFNWFIRPYTAGPVLQPDSYSETLLPLTNHENLLRLGWYLAWPAIWLGAGGICWLLWRVEWGTAVLLGAGLLFTVLYITNIRANPHQVYVMRRFVPAVVPFFLLGGAYLIRGVGAWRLQSGIALRYLPHGAALLLVALWLGGLGLAARGFHSQVDYAGLLEQLAELDAALPPNSILLFDDQSPVGQGDFWGTPLTYLFGHEAYTIRDASLLQGPELAETIEVWQNNGRSVVWFGDPAWLAARQFSFTERQFTLSSRRLESSYVAKPQQIIDEKWPLRVALLHAVP